jgi:hypothetical protein
MDSKDRPFWLTTAIAAAQALCPAGTQGRRPRPPWPVGRAYPAAERGRGWFQVALRKPLDLDKAESLYLADGHGQGVRFSVFETFSDKGLLYIRVMESVQVEDGVLWFRQRESGTLVESLAEQLRGLSPSALTTALAAGRLSPLPSVERHGLNDEQDLAVSACTAPGLHAVWGPPGTGKTRVIAHALRTLRESGNSVLLVSGTNVAVDNALERAAELISGLRAGEFVRVGIPTVRAVADDKRLALAHLVRASLTQVEQERLVIAARIDEIRADARLVDLNSARQQLKGFDPGTYAAAKARIAEFADKERHRLRVHQAEIHCQETAERCDTLETLTGRAETAWQERQGDRQLHAEASGLQAELDEYRLAADRALLRVEADETTLQQRLHEQDKRPGWKLLLLSPAARAALRAGIGDAQHALADSRQRLEQVQGALERTGPELQRRIAACQQAASCSPSDITRLDAERTRLGREAVAARHARQQARTDLRQAEHDLSGVQGAPHPTPTT